MRSLNMAQVAALVSNTHEGAELPVEYAGQTSAWEQVL